MDNHNKIITLLTDFGLKDIYVGVMKGVISQINPQTQIIDLTHEIPPQNVAAGRFCLLNAVPYFPKGTVHIAVVDPGVGTQRRAIALQFPGGYLVGPDNGLLTGILEQFDQNFGVNFNNKNGNDHHDSLQLKPDILAVELTNPDYWQTTQPSTTFHGRDIFAAVGAHLANGIPLEQFGTIINPETLVKLSFPPCQVKNLTIEGSIQYIDGFGNLVTNIPGDLVKDKTWYVTLPNLKKKLKKLRKINVKLKKNKKHKKHLPFDRNTYKLSCLIPNGQTYGDVSSGQLIALVGSHGWVEIALNSGNAQQQLKLDWGATVQVVISNQ